MERRDIDFITYAYSCCGYRTKTTYDYEQKGKDGKNRQLIHYVNVCKNIQGSLRNDGEHSNVSIKRVKTEDGKKYCFTTNSGMFVAQRDGKIFVTGNSSSIECLSYNVICLDVEVLPSKRRGRVRLCLDKNREGGDTGLADVLIMDYKSGLMINAEDYVYDKEKGIMVPPEQLNTGY